MSSTSNIKFSNGLEIPVLGLGTYKVDIKKNLKFLFLYIF